MTQISRPFVLALAAVVLFAGVWFVALKPHTASTGGSEASAPAAPSSSPAQSPAAASAAAEKAAAAPSKVDHTSTPGLEGLTKDINRAHGAVAASQGNGSRTLEKAAQASGTSSTPAAPASAPQAAKPSSTSTSGAAAASSSAAAAAKATAPSKAQASGSEASKSSSSAAKAAARAIPSGQAQVEAALKQNSMALVLFWNPHSAEDQAVHQSVQLVGSVNSIDEALSSNPVTSGQSKGGGSLQKLTVFEGGPGDVSSYGSFTQTVQVLQTPMILIVNPRGQITSIPGYTEAAAITQRLGESRKTAEADAAKAAEEIARAQPRPYTRSVSSAEDLADHLRRPLGRGHCPQDAFTGAAGGAACGDLVRVSIAVDEHSPDGRISDAGFDASGCGTAIAAGSAAVSLLRGAPLLDAARIGAEQISEELGGLSLAKRHAAELAADALHRALGAAARGRAMLAPEPARTLVAMSGGVDSAVAALLVARDGQQAVGVTLELWSDPDNDGELSCCSAQAVRRARELAHGLGLAHLSIDLREEFRAGVVDRWIADHAAGQTPNPCIRCNGSVRLDAMLELGRRLGSERLATGHYARVCDGPLLRMAADVAKDQSYVLSALSPGSLSRLRFPLGELPKARVRELARQAGLAVARRRDSQDLCFLAGTRQGAFLQRHAGMAERRGAIVARDGEVLGAHSGSHLFTVGQRRGLGIGTRAALYVLATDAGANTVTVGPREALLAQSVDAREVTLHRDGGCVDGLRVRSHGRMFACRLSQSPRAGRHERVSVQLREPAERTAPGQLACLYSGDVVVGHGTIAA